MKLLKRALTSPSFIAVFAFVVRFAILWHGQLHGRIPIVEPPFGYETGRIARSIAMGKGFSSPLNGTESGPTIWLTPVYPYFLAGIFKLFGIYSYASLLIATTFNLFFAALTVYPVYYVATQISGRAVAAGAAWLWTLCPLAFVVPLYWIWDSSLTALFSAVVLWATLAIRDSNRTRDWILYGLLWGFSLMVNAALFSILPFLMGWVIWQRQKISLPWLRAAAFASLMIALSCVPWTARNYVVFHKIVPFRSNFGLELWLGNNKDVPDTWTGDLHPNDYAPERAKYVRMGEIAYMEDKQKEAVHFMVTHPSDEVRFIWRRFADTWTLSWDPLEGIWTHISATGRMIMIGNLIEVVFGFLGLLVLSRQRNPYVFPLAVYPLIFPVVYYITHPSWRYRHPIDPIMMVLAAYGIAHVIRVALRRKSTAFSATVESGIASGQSSIPA